VTVMLSFPKNDEKICDDNFLHIFQNNLGVFFVIQIYNDNDDKFIAEKRRIFLLRKM